MIICNRQSVCHTDHTIIEVEKAKRNLLNIIDGEKKVKSKT